jgi:hypothetical protein
MRKQCGGHEMCVSDISVAFIPNTFRSVEYLGAYTREVCKPRVDLRVKYPLIMSSFNQDWNLSTDLSRTPE